MLTRRALLKRTAATLALPALLSSRARAQSNPSNWAVTLDGNTYLSNPTVSLGFPSSSPYGLCIYSYCATTMGANNNIGLVGIGSPYSPGFLGIGHYEDLSNNFYTQISIAGPSGLAMYAYTEIPYDGKWHTIIQAWDATVPKTVFILDGQLVTTSYSPSNTNTGYVSFGTYPLLVGNTTGAQNDNYTGDLANFLLYIPQTYFDPTGASFVDNFFDIETGYAVRNASTGSYTGANSNPPWTPQVFLSGGSELFPMNLANSSGQFNWPDNYSGSSFSVVGTLTTASSDPFAPNSPY